MNSVRLFAGLDYHQNHVQVCVIDPQENVVINRKVNSDVGEVAELLGKLGNVEAVAIEACCGAAAFGESLAGCGPWRVNLAHAGYVSRFKRTPDKTDFSDGRLLADLTRVGYLPHVWLPPAEIRDLRQLVGHRQRLVERRRAIKLQIGALLREQRVKIDGSRWSRPWVSRVKSCPALSAHGRWIIEDQLSELDHVSEQILRCEGRLREATAEDAEYQKLLKIEGVGEVTAWMLRAWVGRFDRFRSGKQLSRYCGLSPRNVSSGDRQSDAGLIDAANKPLRAVLIQAGHRLIARDKRWSELGQSLQRRGKPKCVVVAAIANRWVRTIHHRMVSGGKNG